MLGDFIYRRQSMSDPMNTPVDCCKMGEWKVDCNNEDPHVPDGSYSSCDDLPHPKAYKERLAEIGWRHRPKFQCMLDPETYETCCVNWCDGTFTGQR